MTICLAMIVKDEERILHRCLRSVKPFLDYFVICDTGSTDRTREIILEELKGIPGEIPTHPWVNFGHNKSLMLQAARGKADYILMLDADHEMAGDRPTDLSADQYLVNFPSAISYRLPQLIKGSLPWRYVGPTHEYLDGPYTTQEPIDSFQIIDHGDGRSRPQKFGRDIKLLEEALKAEPENPRHCYYLAQSWRDAGDPIKAREYYLQRSQMAGWEEEGWHAQYQAALLAEQMGTCPFTDLFLEYLEAWARRPHRLEPLTCLVTLCRLNGRHRLGFELSLRPDLPKKDILFLEQDALWKLIFERGLCAWYAGERGIFAEDMTTTINNPFVSQPYRDAAQANLRWIK